LLPRCGATATPLLDEAVPIMTHIVRWFMTAAAAGALGAAFAGSDHG
jgi:hypothetical protein